MPTQTARSHRIRKRAPTCSSPRRQVRTSPRTSRTILVRAAVLWTTDLVGDFGFNAAPLPNGFDRDRDPLADPDYTSRFNGTSAAAPTRLGRDRADARGKSESDVSRRAGDSGSQLAHDRLVRSLRAPFAATLSRGGCRQRGLRQIALECALYCRSSDCRLDVDRQRTASGAPGGGLAVVRGLGRCARRGLSDAQPTENGPHTLSTILPIPELYSRLGTAIDAEANGQHRRFGTPMGDDLTPAVGA